MVEKVYIVVGYTGEYGDYCEWPVVGFKTKTRAKNFCKAAKKQADELTKEIDGDLTWYNFTQETTELDPNFLCDYTGTNYKYTEVEVK